MIKPDIPENTIVVRALVKVPLEYPESPGSATKQTTQPSAQMVVNIITINILLPSPHLQFNQLLRHIRRKICLPNPASPRSCRRILVLPLVLGTPALPLTTGSPRALLWVPHSSYI
jgi:hypothetical protein